METSKPTTSTISGLVSKFAQVCRFTSTEVHIPQHQHELDETNDAAAAPVNLFLPEVNDMLKLFELVSDFKAAYVLLQQAHMPYNPLNIQAADHLAVQALSKIKRHAKVNQTKEKRVLESLKLEAKTKRHRIQSLRRELLQLDLENADLIERLNKKTTSQIQIPRFILDFDAFKDIVTCASTSVHDFAKPLISLMKASGWDLDLAANSVQHSVTYHKRCHKKYAFEAYISRRMFSQQFTAIHQDQDQDQESIIITAALRSDDPMEYLINQPHSAFSNFCRSKYILVIHRDLELSFFGNLDHRSLVLNQKHPRTPFYQAFAKMARWSWILRGVSSTISPKAVVYEVKRGTTFSDKFMELVEQDIKGVAKSRHSDYKVAFMIMPGFRVGENLIKSRVYCCKERSY